MTDFFAQLLARDPIRSLSLGLLNMQRDLYKFILIMCIFILILFFPLFYFRMKLKIAFSVGGIPVSDMAEVNNFPNFM